MAKSRTQAEQDIANAEAAPYTAPAGVDTITSPSGENTAAVPQFVDFSGIAPPFVDFQAAFDFASKLGEENRQKFFTNLRDSSAAALDILRTDITGIQEGANALAPFARAQGELDLNANISRAGKIDDFNFSRLDKFNKYNQGLQKQSIESTGLDYKGRITKLLDQLDTQTSGRLPEGLEQSFQKSIRNQGAEIGAATGISPLSGAGLRASDRMEVSERIRLMENAQRLLPGVLQQGQSTLQAPSIFAQPTQVPLNVSNIEQRIPVQANVSAGALQQSIGTTATEIQTIPATTGLSANLQTQQFNEQGRYNQDLLVKTNQQDYNTALANATQGAINADKGDAIRDQNFAAYQAGLDVRAQEAQLNAQAQIGGAIAGTATSGGLGKLYDTVVGGVGKIIEGGAALADKYFGNGDGKLMVGNTQIDSTGYNKVMNGVGEFFGHKRAPEASPAPTAPAQGGGGASGGGSAQPKQSASSKSFIDASAPLGDTKTDYGYVAKVTNAIFNPDYAPEQRIGEVSKVGVDSLAARGTLTPSQARGANATIDAVGTLSNKNATTAEKITAFGTAAAQAGVSSIEGTVSAPTSINGNKVTGSAIMDDGSHGFMTTDAKGNYQTFSKSEIQNGINTVAGLQAFQVVASDAPTEQKIRALSGIGIGSAKANEIITQVQGGNMLAGLSIINTAVDWDKMNNVQKGIAVIQTGALTTEAIAQGAGVTAVKAGGTGGLSFFSSATAPTATGATGASGTTAAGTAAATGPFTGTNVLAGYVIPGASIVVGTYGMYTTLDAIKDMPRERAKETGAAGGAASGAAIGAPWGIYGAAIGAVVGGAIGFGAGFVGTGKSGDQMERDAWKGNLVKGGFAEKIDGQNKVTLADGSKVTIGMGGTTGNSVDTGGKSDKIVNAKGEKRHVFDVDWSNEGAVNSIPEAHLYAIASGLDPTSSNKLFHQAVGMSLNSASSNTDKVEGVQGNIKAMLKDTDPRGLAARVEVLRVKNDISEEEYGTYLSSINKMYGTQLQPSDRQQVTDSIVGELQAQDPKTLDGGQKKLLKNLTDPTYQDKKMRKLDKRLGIEREQRGEEPIQSPQQVEQGGAQIAGNPRDPGRGGNVGAEDVGTGGGESFQRPGRLLNPQAPGYDYGATPAGQARNTGRPYSDPGRYDVPSQGQMGGGGGQGSDEGDFSWWDVAGALLQGQGGQRGPNGEPPKPGYEWVETSHGPMQVPIDRQGQGQPSSTGGTTINGINGPIYIPNNGQPSSTGSTTINGINGPIEIYNSEQGGGQSSSQSAPPREPFDGAPEGSLSPDRAEEMASIVPPQPDPWLYGENANKPIPAGTTPNREFSA